jgi:hypothetical protein
MKRIFYIVILVIINLLLQISCNEECVDNLTAQNNKIPYKKKTVIQFKNDTLGICYDTITPFIGEITKGSDDDFMNKCSGGSMLFYSNFFFILVNQDPDYLHNKIEFVVCQAIPWIISQNPVHYQNEVIYPITDTIVYTYKDQSIKAIKISYPFDTVGSAIWNESLQTDSNYVYNNYIFIINPQIKLLEYTTVYRDGTRRVWRLQE